MPATGGPRPSIGRPFILGLPPAGRLPKAGDAAGPQTAAVRLEIAKALIASGALPLKVTFASSTEDAKKRAADLPRLTREMIDEIANAVLVGPT